MEHQGTENRRQVWKRMEGFHGNLGLPVAKVALQIPQASFPWTLKPASLAAESSTLERLGCSAFGKGGTKRGEAKLFCWNQGAGSWEPLKMPLNRFCRSLPPPWGRDPPKPAFLPCFAFYTTGPQAPGK